MFNTGYKKIVINDDEGIIVNGSTVTIPGYGTYDKGNIVETLAAREPVGELATWLDPPSGGDYVDVKLVLTGVKTDRREVIYFNAKSPSDADIVAGYNAWLKLHNLEIVAPPKIADVAVELTSGLVTKIQLGHENVLVSDIYVRTGKFDEVGITHHTTRLTKAITIEAEPGWGMGWQLEASVKLGTFENYNPYGQQHGGNSNSIDLKAKYTAIFVKTPEIEFAPWKQHKYVEHAYVNADMPTDDIKFIIYVREDLAGPLS